MVIRRTALLVSLVAILCPDGLEAEPGARVERLSDRRDATAVALGPDGRSVAFGSERGVWRVDPTGTRRVLHGLDVRDLLFDDAGALWVASDRGLERLFGGRVEDLSPGPGAARDVRRLAHGPAATLLVGTARGAYLGGEAGWRLLDGAAPTGEVTSLAYQAPDRVWLVADGDLHLLQLLDDPRDARVGRSSRRSLPGARQTVVDLLPGATPGSPPLLLTADRLLVPTEGGGLEILPARLPPGAAAVRLARAAGGLWVATDRGLTRVSTRDGRLEPAPAGLGSAAVHAVTGSAGGDLLVAGERGVVRLLAPGRGATAGRRAESTPGPAEPVAAERKRAWAAAHAGPPVRQVRLAALRAMDLGAGPRRRRATRVRVRGWLPEVELRAGYGGARRRDRDVDEAFTSGEPRVFRDRDQSRTRDFDLFAVLRWDLGDTVYHAEELDVSKEARELIELTDEILDEVHQLYFERRRLLLELADRLPPGQGAAPPSLPSDPETARIALRIDELSAGLDAWTGGWWSARVSSLLSPRFAQEPTP